MKPIEELKNRVAAIMPAGWAASECFLLSLSGATSPEMVSVYRVGYREHMKQAKTPEQRKELRQQWNTETISQAQHLEQGLKLAGMKVRRDCGDIYVIPQ